MGLAGTVLLPLDWVYLLMETTVASVFFIIAAGKIIKKGNWLQIILCEMGNECV